MPGISVRPPQSITWAFETVSAAEQAPWSGYPWWGRPAQISRGCRFHRIRGHCEREWASRNLCKCRAHCPQDRGRQARTAKRRLRWCQKFG